MTGGLGALVRRGASRGPRAHCGSSTFFGSAVGSASGSGGFTGSGGFAGGSGAAVVGSEGGSPPLLAGGAAGADGAVAGFACFFLFGAAFGVGAFCASALAVSAAPALAPLCAFALPGSAVGGGALGIAEAGMTGTFDAVGVAALVEDADAAAGTFAAGTMADAGVAPATASGARWRTIAIHVPIPAANARTTEKMIRIARPPRFGAIVARSGPGATLATLGCDPLAAGGNPLGCAT